ncbi:hypothetical protein [Bacillus cihuensis]|uniref:hypothetical protein n=1 Tax=Bacillus cihuensis TaxID=1208599 RepID=UPI0004102A60|nr:hypothetical protein [Bacillus cihuensis]
MENKVCTVCNTSKSHFNFKGDHPDICDSCDKVAYEKKQNKLLGCILVWLLFFIVMPIFGWLFLDWDISNDDVGCMNRFFECE